MSKEVERYLVFEPATKTITKAAILDLLGVDAQQVLGGREEITIDYWTRVPYARVVEEVLADHAAPAARDEKVAKPAHIRINARVKTAGEWYDELKLTPHAFRALVEEGKYTQLSRQESAAERRARGSRGNPKFFRRQAEV